MDTKKLFIALLFIAIVAFSGCTQKKPAQQIQTTAAFAGGSEGLKISFLPGQPAEQVFENQPFQIGLLIENKGEGEVGEAAVSISGISAGTFRLDSSVKTITASALTPVRKVGTSIVPGGQTQVIFSGTNPDIAGAQAKYPIQATVNYKYKSIALADACLKENIYAQTTGGAESCTMIGPKTVSASGAPVKVTAIEELPTGFKITVKNVGKGYPFKVNETAFQQSKVDPLAEKDRVRVTKVMLGSQSILENCTVYTSGAVDQPLYLVNNEAQFYCSAQLGGQTATVVEQLLIELSYGYSESISTTLNVMGVTV